jgi:osmotically-inducible protein OsmY
MPPDTPAPQEQGEANPDQPAAASAQVAEQIQHALDTEPLLKDSTLKVEVDDTKVTISGTVNNQKEREMALSAAALYAGEREIVDRIKIKT